MGRIKPLSQIPFYLRKWFEYPSRPPCVRIKPSDPGSLIEGLDKDHELVHEHTKNSALQ